MDSLRWLAMALMVAFPLMPGSGPGVATADDYDGPNYLLEGWELNMGMAIGVNYTLHMQSDCNLVLYPHGLLNKPMWASNTAGKAENCNLIMQEDCNAVVYKTGTQKALWASQTAGRGIDCRLLVQDDGNVVIYDGFGAPQWSIQTEVHH